MSDQGQTGSTSFNQSKSMTSTSTPKDIQGNTKLQLQQKSTIKTDKQLTSLLFGYQNNALTDNTDTYDPEENELNFGNWLPPSVNQRTRKKTNILYRIIIIPNTQMLIH